MTSYSDRLTTIAVGASALFARIETEGFSESLDALFRAVESAGKSFCGSWLGYHSRVYYSELKPVPPDASFDPTWGLMTEPPNVTNGEWEEYEFDSVFNQLKCSIPRSAYESLVLASNDTSAKVDELREDLISILVLATTSEGDRYLTPLVGEIRHAAKVAANKFVDHVRPTGRLDTYDKVAALERLKTPPHIALYAEVMSMKSAFTAAKNLAALANRAERHFQNKRQLKVSNNLGTKVFIGHGRAREWQDLKDFIQDRLKNSCDEFNRVPVAGKTNIARLTEMLDGASIAFLVMTAEDAQVDGSKNARLNVIHEAGLFQGRLGFNKAIILLEDGCEGFSNIDGLGQIRFPKGNIKACFEEVRRVMEREELVPR
jgi:predicted nucleotide-binding protein